MNKELLNKLSTQKYLSQKGITLIANFYKVPPEELIYLYLQGDIPQVHHFDENMFYAFHGRECAVKTKDWYVDIEFGIHGSYTSISSGTLSLISQEFSQDVNTLIEELIQNHIINIPDEELLTLSRRIISLSISEQDAIMQKLSFKEQVDLAVADRFIILDIE
ncbi:MAG: DUF6896 domain-containing protein [Wohlfahrtiimonas sp.]